MFILPVSRFRRPAADGGKILNLRKYLCRANVGALPFREPRTSGQSALFAVKQFINFLFRHNAWMLLALLSALSLLVMKLEREEVPQKLLEGGLAFRAGLAEQFGQIAWRLGLSEENGRLMRLNATLLSQLLQRESELRQQQQLKALLADPAADADGYVVARVVERTFSDRENILIINAGKLAGVRQGMSVLTPRGLVGRVVAVSNQYARVMPVIHTDFKVGVTSSKSGSMGVMSWNGGNEERAFIEHIPQSSPLEVGEVMATSGVSTFAVEGIPVGTVVDIQPDRLFSRVEIRLAVEFSSLGHVLVAPLQRESEVLRLLMREEPDKEQ